jgi:hypothetical protein
MLKMLRILQMIIDAQKLKASVGKLEGLLAPLAAFLLLGMFLTALAALTVGALLFSLFRVFVAAGLNPVSSGIIVTLVLIAAFIGGVAMMYRLTRRLSGGMKTVMHADRPLMGQVGHVAESFISGLLQSEAPTITRGPKP